MSWNAFASARGQAPHAPGLRRAAIGAGVAAAVIGCIGAAERPRHVTPAEPPREARCAAWDAAAADAIALRVRAGDPQGLREAGDLLFRLRRARRNCEAGWTALACQDYRTIASGAGIAPRRLVC